MTRTFHCNIAVEGEKLLNVRHIPVPARRAVTLAVRTGKHTHKLNAGAVRRKRAFHRFGDGTVAYQCSAYHLSG